VEDADCFILASPRKQSNCLGWEISWPANCGLFIVRYRANSSKILQLVGCYRRPIRYLISRPVQRDTTTHIKPDPGLSCESDYRGLEIYVTVNEMKPLERSET
jgi:hypothetical protein